MPSLPNPQAACGAPSRSEMSSRIRQPLDPPAVARAPGQSRNARQLEALASGRCLRLSLRRGLRIRADPHAHAGTAGRSHAVAASFATASPSVDPAGGPWRRGYLRAELDITPQQWFFEGHFKNDPCMPGTLMFEGCLQALAVYLAANGHALERDGWRFQPVPGIPYQLQCRGQGHRRMSRSLVTSRSSSRKSSLRPRSRHRVCGSAVHRRWTGASPCAPRGAATCTRLPLQSARSCIAGEQARYRLACQSPRSMDSHSIGRAMLRLRHRQAIGSVRPDVPTLRWHPACRTPARAAVSVHEPHRRSPWRDRRDDGRRTRHGGSVYDIPDGCKVLRIDNGYRMHAVRRAARSRTATLRLAVELCRFDLDGRRRTGLPQSRRRGPSARRAATNIAARSPPKWN